jgi:2-dehydropantoate 2-reductase
MLYQLEKLAMNAVINPLTALMNCENGELLYNYSLTRVTRLLLHEISSVICALPELQGIPGIESRFSPERLRWMVTQLASKTAKNHSSMLQDVRAGKTTEIEYLNGYIVRRGEELGIKCVVNYMMKHLVLGKQHTSKQRDASAIPIDIL